MTNFQKWILFFIIIIILGGTLFFFFQKREREKEIFPPPTLPKNMKILSPAFENNSPIPSKYTCDGENINPPLEIQDLPQGTQSLVFIVDDPDAPRGTFLHWLVWNIPPDTFLIEENNLPVGSVQGRNDFGREDWGGPCPPSARHRYFFKIYALDTKLNLPSGSSLKEVKEAMKDHILGKSQIVGLYQRR